VYQRRHWKKEIAGGEEILDDRREDEEISHKWKGVRRGIWPNSA
jgi:hypothetical protein